MPRSAGASVALSRTFHSDCRCLPHSLVSRSTTLSAQSSPRPGISRRNRHSSGVDSCAYTSCATTSAGTSSASTSTAANSGALAGLFCRAATNSFGLARRAAATSDRLVVSLSVPATKPTARSIPACGEHVRVVAAADDRVGIVGRRRPAR